MVPVRTALLLLLLLLELRSGVRAEPPPPRVTVVLAADEAAARELRAGLDAGAVPPVELRVEDAPNAPLPLRPDDGELAARLAEARARYIEADFEGCLARLPDDPALTDVIGRGTALLAARALLWRAACEMGRGSVAEASRAAEQLAVMAFELPSDVGSVSPEVERLVTDALRAAQRGHRVALRVVSRGEPAQVSLDGRTLGCVTPCALDVAPGEHVIGLSGDGLTASYVRTSVGAGMRELALDTAPAPPELARSQWTAQRGKPGRELDDAASLRLLTRAMPAQKLVLLCADPVQGERVELRGTYAIDGRIAARALTGPVSRAQLDDEGPALVRELLVRGNTLAPARPVWKSPWLWVAVGVGAAAAATATALLLRQPEQRTEIRIQ